MQKLLGDILRPRQAARRGVGRRRMNAAFGIGLALAAPVLVGLTFVVLGPLNQNAASPALRIVLLLDLIYVLVVVALIAQRVMQLVMARRARSAGSRLHLRLTAIFAFVALIPSILVAIFAVLTINVGLEGWFSERVRNVVGSSLQAAQAYSDEHRAEMLREAERLRAYLTIKRRGTFFMHDGDIRQALGEVSVQYRDVLSEVFVIDSAAEIRARGGRSYEFDYEAPTPEQIARAETGETVVIEDFENYELRALLPMEEFSDRLLLVSRTVDGSVMALLDDTRESVRLYQKLEADRGQLLFEFGLLYLGFAVILMLGAIWIGLMVAERLSRPIGRLVGASQKVGEGDLTVRVREDSGEDEIALLGRNFNAMTSRLHQQREELLTRTRQIEERRRLFDSVLSSVTSGVVGLDRDGRVTFVNRSAERLLEVSDAQTAQELMVAVPEFGALFERLSAAPVGHVQEQVQLIRGGQPETLLVRMAPRWGKGAALEGYVVAFDDVTDLVSAQRMAAWGDVARRIAHEIKNPLTPIQLSAERIKRKFRGEVEDSAALEQMTDVIVRQTNDLRRIVDEFSKFARMPEPDRTRQDLTRILRDALLLQESGQPNVRFVTDVTPDPCMVSVDAAMISQALTNLMKNAGEAIDDYREKSAPTDHDPEIRVTLTRDDEAAQITISDNGIGLPDDRSKLFEPYVTTRDKGTGLGLPIVKKIIEEHGGTLTLDDAMPFSDIDHRGACAVVTLPLLTSASDSGDLYE